MDEDEIKSRVERPWEFVVFHPYKLAHLSLELWTEEEGYHCLYPGLGPKILILTNQQLAKTTGTTQKLWTLREIRPGYNHYFHNP